MKKNTKILKIQGILLLSAIVNLCTGCDILTLPTFRLVLEPIKTIDSKMNGLEIIEITHDSELTEFTGFNIVIKNNYNKQVYFNPFNCKIKISNGETYSYLACNWRKVIKKERWEREDLKSRQRDIDIPAPPDYYFGDIPLYSYEMSEIKSLLFEEGFILPGEEKKGHIIFPFFRFKGGEKIQLELLYDSNSVEFFYQVVTIKRDDD